MERSYNELEKAFEVLGIEVNIMELNPDIWKKILKAIKKLYKEYPEVQSGLLRKINIIRPKYNFLCATSFSYDEKNSIYDISSGIDLDLSYYRFSDINNMKIKLETTNIDISLDDTIEFVIAHAFGMILEINLGIMTGEINREKESKSKYEEYISNSQYSKMIVENVFKKINLNENAEYFIKREISETAAASYNSLFSEAVAFHYFGKDNDITNEVIKEYKKIKDKSKED